MKELIALGCLGAAVLVAGLGIFSGESDQVKALEMQNQHLTEQLRDSQNKLLGCYAN